MHHAVLSAYDRIRPLVRETPLEYSEELGAWLKLELLQTTGSFKFRGAANKIALLTPEQAAAGVVAASNGNHGLGVAAAAQARGIAAEVFVSSQVSPAKAHRIERLGARLRCAGEDPLAAELAARRAAARSGRVFISPYNDADVMAGPGHHRGGDPAPASENRCRFRGGGRRRIDRRHGRVSAARFS